MKKGNLFIILVLTLILTLVGCSKSDNSNNDKQGEYSMCRSGSINEDETWNGKVHVAGPTVVSEGATLTIEPGTVVEFKHGNSYENYLAKNQQAYLRIVEGTLKAIGTPQKPIWFTSDRESPINGDWEGISLVWSNDNELEYVIVEYADIGIELELYSDAEITNSIIRWSHSGIYGEVHSSVVARSNRIYQVGHEPIAIEEYCDAIIEDNEIVDSNSGLVLVDSNATISGNLIANHRGEGMEILGVWGNSDVVFSNNKITQNSGTILQTGKGSRVEIVSNDISDNDGNLESFDASQFILRNNAIRDNNGTLNIFRSLSVDITDNWWGTTDKDEIASTIISDEEIIFKPFLQDNPVQISLPQFDYPDVKKTELGYIPGDPADKYIHIFPEEDDTRKVLRRIGQNLEYQGVGWSLCWDGQVFWTFRHDSGVLVKLDPDTGSILEEFTIPDINRSRGIAFDGKHLWVNDFANMKVFEIDPLDGQILSEFQIPGEIGIVQTIVWDGQHLYLSQYGESRLYKVDKLGNVLDIIELEIGGTTTLTWNGKSWWTSGGDGALYKLDPSGKIIGMINGAALEPWAITWDGEHLWTLQRLHERWGRVPRLFEIEVIDDQIAFSRLKSDDISILSCFVNH